MITDPAGDLLDAGHSVTDTAVHTGFVNKAGPANGPGACKGPRAAVATCN